MKSESLEFETEFEGRYFLVSYESESPLQNLLMSIVYENLPIDTLTLRNHNLALYRHIKLEILKDAAKYWEDKTEPIYQAARSFNSQFKR